MLTVTSSEHSTEEGAKSLELCFSLQKPHGTYVGTCEHLTWAAVCRQCEIYTGFLREYEKKNVEYVIDNF